PNGHHRGPSGRSLRGAAPVGRCLRRDSRSGRFFHRWGLFFLDTLHRVLLSLLGDGGFVAFHFLVFVLSHFVWHVGPPVQRFLRIRKAPRDRVLLSKCYGL